jgi:hypothetical protein
MLSVLSKDLLRIMGIDNDSTSGYAARALNYDNTYALAICRLQRLIPTQKESGRVRRRLLDVNDRVLAFKAVSEGTVCHQ